MNIYKYRRAAKFVALYALLGAVVAFTKWNGTSLVTTFPLWAVVVLVLLQVHLLGIELLKKRLTV